jgi:GNAT superfamily N-acetyltransferase
VGNIQIDVQESADSERVQLLVRRLVASNDLVAPPENHERLAVFASHEGELVGGASGHTHWDWLFVSHLWVDEAHRHQRLGSTLMDEIEQAAARRGARAVHLDTYDFQALGFYQARGYRIFDQLDDYRPATPATSSQETCPPCTRMGNSTGPGSRRGCRLSRRRLTVRAVSASGLGPWKPLDLQSVVEVFSSAPFRWWISGGHALELHLGRTWRGHEDTDVGVARQDLGAVHTHLAGWDVHVAAAGELTPWRGESLTADRHQNNVWCRTAPGGPWVLDLTIGEGTDETWIFRRDPTLKVPWDLAVLRTPDGIPYLAPELQLLFKSKAPRAKDDIDAAQVIPALDDVRCRLLANHLAAEHPWRCSLR